jgi:aerotolerance regulator-like protein/VWA domain-containing protein
MLGLSFFNQPMLYGLAALALPVIIHLFFRARRQRINFSSIIFLKHSQEKISYRFKFWEMILLLLRILTVAVLVLAFARPLLSQFYVGQADKGANGDIVIIIDDSASMSMRVGGGEILGQARDWVRKKIKKLTYGDQLGFVTTSDPYKPRLGLNQNFRLAEEELDSIVATEGHYRLGPALELAGSMLAPSTADNKQIFLLTDSQKSAVWGNDEGSLKPVSIGEDVECTIVKIGPENSGNVAVNSVEFPQLTWARGQPTRIIVNLNNYGDKAVTSVAIKLYLKNRIVAQDKVDIPPKSSKNVELEYRFSTGGAYTGYVEIQAADDNLYVDNKFYFQIVLQDAIQVLILDNSLSREKYDHDSYFLQKALTVQPDTKTGSSSGFSIKVIAPSNFGNIDIFDYDCLVLCNISKLSESNTERIYEFVKNGGGLIIFPGDSIDFDYYNKELFTRGKGIFPLSMEGFLGDTENRTQAYSLKNFSFENPVIDSFKESYSLSLRTPRFFKLVDFRITNDSEDRVISWLGNKGDDIPGIYANQYYQGKALMFNMTANAEWTDLPKRSAYLILMQEAVRYVSSIRNGFTNNYQVGDNVPIRTNFDAETKVAVTPPENGRKINLKVGKDGTAFFSKTDKSGLYDVAVGGGKPQPLFSFAVNFDKNESDLTYISEKELASKLITSGETRTITVGAPEEVEADHNVQDTAWRYLMLLGLIFLLSESLITNYVLLPRRPEASLLPVTEAVDRSRK